MKIPFVGGSYNLRTRRADVQRSVNLFPTAVESTPGKAELRSVPGLVQFANLVEEVRGFCVAQGRLFAVAGATLYEVDSLGVGTSRGTLLTTTGAVSMDNNRTQLILMDGSNGYTLTLLSNTFQTISNSAFYGSDRVVVTAGRAVLVRTGTDTFYYTAIDNALSFDALDFATAESSPDGIVTHLVDHGQLFLFGELGCEVWDNTGGTDFTFARNTGANIETGCAAALSAQKLDNTIFWVGQDEHGAGIVWKMQGYTPIRISTAAVEQAIQASTDISGAVAYTYQQDGHSFYVLQVPGLETTWVYDAGAGAWHERAEFVDGVYTQHRGTCHVYAYGKNLVGTATGKIYEYDPDVNVNGSDVLCRDRVSPHLDAPSKSKMELNSFQVDCNTGDGLSSGQAAQMMLRYSKNGGQTWSSWRYVSLGEVGRWSTRAKILRLGKGRDWVFQARCTDDVPFSIVGADAA